MATNIQPGITEDENIDDYEFDDKEFEEDLRRAREKVQREYAEKHPEDKE